MDKGIKIISAILGVLAVVFLGIYFFLSAVNKQIPRPVEYPKSGMSQSIFEAQNTKYVQNSGLTQKHTFTHCPYSVDITDSDVAKVSDTGAVYKLSDSMYFYITEFQSGTNIESVIKSELPQAVMIDSNADMTGIDNYIYEEGYLNGFKGDYYIDCMTVTNGTRTSSVYITGYALTITDTTLDHGYKMFLGVMAAKSDTDTYNNAKGMLDAVVNTYQVNYDVQNALVDAENQAVAEEEQKKQEAMDNGETYIPATQPEKTPENLIVNSDGSTTDMAANAGETDNSQYSQQDPGVNTSEYIKKDAIINNGNNSAGDGQGGMGDAAIPQAKTKSMTLDREYTGVTLYYSYTNVDEDISVVLESPDGTQTFSPQSTDAGKMVFKLDRMEAGKWKLQISGNPGSDAMRLYSEQMDSTDGSSDTADTDAQNGE